MRPLRHIVAALAVTGLLAGCSSEDTFPRVVYLKPPAPAPSAAATGVDPHPPAPVDATAEERARKRTEFRN